MPDSEIVVTDNDGNQLPDIEAEKLLKRLQTGVVYVPQAS